MPPSIPVLIVGAGPSGLMLACELARRNVPFRLIDKKQEPTQSSNATWVQPRTLEIFDLLGIIDPFLHHGNPCDSLQFYINGEPVCDLPVSGIVTPYPFMMMLPQSYTERFLTEKLTSLGGEIEWGVNLTGVLHTESGVNCNLTNADGEIEMLTCDWLVGADGSNSSVREFCGVSFAGEDLSEQFIVADATIESSGLSKKSIHLFFEPGMIFAAFPLGHDKYRITANLHLPYPRKLFTDHEVIEMAQERAHGAYYVKKVEWISPFWVHSKVVKKMRHGSVFLVGDAAHIHSPVGGQGMNTGIQDAFNLGWKLAMVIQGKAKPTLLDTYHEERYPIAHRVVRDTERATKLMLSENGFTKSLQTFADHLTLPLSRAIETQLETLTELNVRYENSLAVDQANVSGQSLYQGVRAPDVLFGSHSRLYDGWRDGSHHALLFLGVAPSEAKVKAAKDLQAHLQEKFKLPLTVVTREPLPGFPNALLDEAGHAHETYHASTPMLYVIRPDNVIAYASKSVDLDALQAFLNRYFIFM